MAKIKKSEQLGNARETILNAAVSLFSVRGYTGTTMRDIAEEVGVLPGSLYAHIKGKEELLAEIVTTGIAEFLDIQKQIEASNDGPEAKLREAIRLHINLVAKSPERTLVVFHQWRFLSEPKHSSAVRMRRRYAEMFADILAEQACFRGSKKDPQIKIQCFTILGALNWTPEWYLPDGPYSPDELSERIADSLIDGLDF